MAQGNNEHRMVFDIRGRRRHVVKFVYALLAILMAGSLFLVTGAVNLNSIFGTSASGETAAQVAEKQAVAIEQRIKKEPANEEVLLGNLTRARVTAANAMYTELASQSHPPNPESKNGATQLSKASEDWTKYLAVAKEPSIGVRPGRGAGDVPVRRKLDVDRRGAGKHQSRRGSADDGRRKTAEPRHLEQRRDLHPLHARLQKGRRTKRRSGQIGEHQVRTRILRKQVRRSRKKRQRIRQTGQTRRSDQEKPAVRIRPAKKRSRTR